MLMNYETFRVDIILDIKGERMCFQMFVLESVAVGKYARSYYEKLFLSLKK